MAVIIKGKCYGSTDWRHWHNPDVALRVIIKGKCYGSTDWRHWHNPDVVLRVTIKGSFTDLLIDVEDVIFKY